MARARGGRGELALIARIRARAGAARGSRELRLGIGDDCAIVRPRRGEEIVVTTDFSLEGRHFRRDWHPARSVGHRVLARGLSDLAAMGARPVAAFLSLALPRAVAADEGWVEEFLDGLLGLARRVGVPLAGGDTAEAPGEGVLADVVLLGAVAQGRALRRDGTRVGDRLFVTGELGGAAAELGRMIRGEGGVSGRQMYPEARLGVGRRLVGTATAAMDVSDGLSTDVRHLCEASGVGVEVEAGWLPLDAMLAGMAEEERMRMALDGGEDYELLFTAAAGAKVPRRIAGVKVTEIGRVVERRRGRPMVVLVGVDGRRRGLEAGGWEHLR